MGIDWGKIFIVVAAYFIGAIPFGLLIAKFFYHIDIREHGSGNPGATNVWRTLGKKPGIATLILDIGKGILPVYLAGYYEPFNEGLAILAGLAAIIGHNWSICLKGKGGKGVATSAGVFLALIPKQALVALLAFAIVFSISKRVSVGSMVAAFTLFASTFYFDTTTLMRIVVVLAAIMLLIKHVPNMKRLAKGTEPKVKFR